MPARNASSGSIINIDRVDVYRLIEPLSAPLSLTEESFVSRSTLIASVPVSKTDFAKKQLSYSDTLEFAGQSARLRYAIRFVNDSGQKAAFSNFF
jgi:tRNA A37 N6-isopentenylltransferase MiaA